MRGAGGGRPRKPDGQRINRHPLKGAVVVYGDARGEMVPEPLMPLTVPQRRLWDALWSQPIATLWCPADVPALTRLVMLQTSDRAQFDGRLLAETRQLEDRFLLSPYARAQQRVVIVEPEEDEPETPVRRYGHLRAMTDGGGEPPI